MKPEIARHIVENGGLLAKDSVLMLLDYVESADRKIAQLVTDRQRFKELAQSNLLRAEAAKEELNAIMGEQQPVAWISERNLKNLGKQLSVYVKHEPVMVRPVALYTHPAVLPPKISED